MEKFDFKIIYSSKRGDRSTYWLSEHPMTALGSTFNVGDHARVACIEYLSMLKLTDVVKIHLTKMFIGKKIHISSLV